MAAAMRAVWAVGGGAALGYKRVALDCVAFGRARGRAAWLLAALQRWL
jgi:hypothetical protein